MTKKVTKLFTLLCLCTSLTLGAISFTACGDGGDKYELNDDGQSYTFVKYNGSADIFEIPAEYKGLPVTKIDGLAFGYNKSIKSVTIPDTVDDVAGFIGCTSLVSVTLPDSVTSIMYSAFEGCVLLTDITIPDGVTSIGDSAFRYCKSLKEVTLPDNLYGIGSGAFKYCSSLTDIIIPDGVEIIHEGAFAECRSLKNIDVSGNNNSYKSINGNLYSKDGKTLLQYAIGKADTEFTLPDSVTMIEEEALAGCASLSQILVENNNKDFTSKNGNLYCKDGETLVQYAIGKDVKEFTIPENVTEIWKYALSDCKHLVKILSESANYKSIDGNLYCHTHKNSTIFKLVQYAVGKTDIAFEIPDNVKELGFGAFSSCASLKSITLSDIISSIPVMAFDNCPLLTTLKYKGTKEEWKKELGFTTSWIGNVTIKQIQCSDGTVAL